MREANDRGFECCLITDGTGATDAGNHAAAHKMVTMQGGVFGTIANSEAVVAALEALPRANKAAATTSATEQELPKPTGYIHAVPPPPLSKGALGALTAVAFVSGAAACAMVMRR